MDFDWVRIVDQAGIGLLAVPLLIIGVVFWKLLRAAVNFIVDWTAALVFNRGPKARLTDRTGHTD